MRGLSNGISRPRRSMNPRTCVGSVWTCVGSVRQTQCRAVACVARSPYRGRDTRHSTHASKAVVQPARVSGATDEPFNVRTLEESKRPARRDARSPAPHRTAPAFVLYTRPSTVVGRQPPAGNEGATSGIVGAANPIDEIAPPSCGQAPRKRSGLGHTNRTDSIFGQDDSQHTETN